MATSRVEIDSLDPRTLFVNGESLELVQRQLQLVEAQYEKDKARYKASKTRQNKHLRDASRGYLSLLRDWREQAEVSLGSSSSSTNATAKRVDHQSSSDDPVEAKFVAGARRRGLRLSACVECTPGVMLQGSLQSRKCVFDTELNTYYVYLRDVRGTIYGEVASYVEGKLDPQEGYVVPTDRIFAVKIFRKALVASGTSTSGMRVQEDPFLELAVQQKLTLGNNSTGHPNVMPLFRVLHSQRKMFAVLPFVKGGELFELIHREKGISEQRAQRIFKGCIDSVHYCHQQGVCHRDISLENFMLDEREKPYLIDFGLSVVMQTAPNQQNPQVYAPIPHTGAVGKVFYMAPEVFSGGNVPYDGRAVDVFSLGSSLFIALCGVPLFNEAAPHDDSFRIALMQHRLRDVMRSWNFNFREETHDLLERMLEVDPSKRPTLPEVARHPFFALQF